MKLAMIGAVVVVTLKMCGAEVPDLLMALAGMVIALWALAVFAKYLVSDWR